MRVGMMLLALAAAPLAVPAAALAEEPIVEEEEERYAAGPERPPDPFWGHLTLGLGVRQVGEDEAGFAMSLEVDLQREHWPLGLLLNMNVAVADGPTVVDPWFGPHAYDVQIVDFGVGARKVFHRKGPVQAFLSVGGAVYAAGVSSCSYGGWYCDSLDDDVTFGPFADGGVFFRTRGRSVFGFRVRYNVGEVTLLGQEISLDGVDVQASWGLHF